ncbi:MAG: mechanosensitive ion channel family protein [Microthrixaceae bacterium]
MFTTTMNVIAQAQEETEAVTEVDLTCSSQGPVCEVLYEVTGNERLSSLMSFLLGAPLKIAIIVAGALILNRISRKAVGRITKRLGTVTAEHGDAVVTGRSVERAKERADTIGSLLRSVSAAAILVGASLMILNVFGISAIPAIASAGVLGLAIGFGAQSVVEDLLRGVFMLAEDQFGVGDRIDIGVVNGTVQRVTLRTVVVRDAEGTLWHVPNSEIDRVANENQQSSRASVVIGVSYEADIAEAIDVLQVAAREAADDTDWSGKVTQPPEVQGVQELGDDAVQIRVVSWVTAGERRRFERHLRLRLKEALDDAAIEMPNRQVDVWLRDQPVAA